MPKSQLLFDRLIFIKLGIILILLGLWPVLMYFDVSFALNAARWVDHSTWAAIPKQSWYVYLLAGLGIVALFLGLWLGASNIRTLRFNSVESESFSTKAGKITTSYAPVSQGIARGLEQQPGITKVHRKISVEKGQPTISFDIVADPTLSLDALRALVEQTERDFRAAFPDTLGTQKIVTGYRLHYDKVT
ncbi:MAG: hypothetical protein SOW59_02170 [Corynebacterium sp.]|nr:hypothetical protein [Corynebacterium sp.]